MSKTPKRSKNNIAAVIDIGSNDLRLIIAQAGKNGIQYLEHLSFPLGLGRDTFQTGKMSFEKADKACDIIKNFMTVAVSYGVQNIQAVATTAVREADNMDYILDQIKIKTGMLVHVIDDTEEKLYIYKLLMHFMKDSQQQSALMVYIGTGNIGVSLLDKGKLPFMRNIKVGSLRMGELFGNMEEYTIEFYRVMEEYLATFTDLLSEDIPPETKQFIVTGHDIGVIAELCGVKMEGLLNELPKEQFLALYQDIKLKTADKIAIDYGISDDRAEVLLPATCIYQTLLKFTHTDNITASRLLPCDAILYEMLYPRVFAAVNKSFAKNTLLSARTLAHRYNILEAHSALVYGLAMDIFQKMKKIHGMGNREKLLLQTAAILHDIGKYVNIRNHYRHSYELVSGSDIVGLNQLETEIVALICLFHSHITPSADVQQYVRLDVDHRVLVSKLAAILRLADALDRSHRQKVKKGQVNVKISEEALYITVTTHENVALEQWAFAEKGRFFEEVFGIKATLRVKRPGR